ncbi:MAG: TolC family protein [Verrucomicrobia bacterium]|nr:TolC family protein [Verrucomicrobiota bacterium]
MKAKYLGLLFLSGCMPDKAVVDPDSYAPATSHAVWKKPSKSEEKAPIINEDIPLSLAEIVDIALRLNPSTKLTWAQARFAAAQYGIAQAPDFPEIGSTYSYSRSRSFSSPSSTSTTTGTGAASTSTTAGSAVAAPTKFYSSQWGPQLQLTYTLLDFGQTRNSILAAKQALYEADFTHNREIQTVIQTVSDDYYNLLFQRAQLKAFEADLETAQTSFDAAQLGLDAGVKDLSDLLQAKTQLLQIQIDITSQRQNIVVAQSQLLTDMGLSSHQAIQVEEIPAIPSLDKMTENADVLLAIAMEKRQDLLAAEAAVKSQEANVDLARSQFYPTVGYSLNYGQTNFGKFGKDHCDWQSSFTLSFPIFSGFSMINNLKAAKAKQAQAEAQYRQTQLTVIQDITTAHSGVRTTFDNLKVTDELLSVSRQEYDVALARYKAGVGNILELMSAQSSLADARSTQVQGIRDWLTSLVQLSFAAGTLEPPYMKEVN